MGLEEDTIDMSELRRIVGLGVHVTEVKSTGRCYMTGFFNALEAFQFNIGVASWRLAEATLAIDLLK